MFYRVFLLTAWKFGFLWNFNLINCTLNLFETVKLHCTSGKLPYIRYLINVRPSSLELREGYIPVHVSDCLNLDPFFTKELFSMVFFRLYAPVQARYDS